MQDDVRCPLCDAPPKGWKPRLLDAPKQVTCHRCGCRYEFVTYLSYEVESLGRDQEPALDWSDGLKKLRAHALADVQEGANLRVEEGLLYPYQPGVPPDRLTAGKVTSVDDKFITVRVKTLRGERAIAFHRRSGLSLWSFRGEDHYNGFQFRIADENFPYFKTAPRRG